MREGRFRPLAAERDTAAVLRVTDAPPGAPPEAGEISLVPYEGSAIVVRGIDEGEWIYAGTVVEHADVILTAVVQQVFGTGSQHRLTYPLA